VSVLPLHKVCVLESAYNVTLNITYFDIRFDGFDGNKGAENGRGTGFADSGRLEEPAGL